MTNNVENIMNQFAYKLAVCMQMSFFLFIKLHAFYLHAVVILVVVVNLINYFHLANIFGCL